MFSTRLLMTCAAIGVGSGLVFTAAGLVNGIIAATIPVIYGLSIGVYFLPGAIAQSLLRRGGVAIVTGMIAGLVASAVNPAFVMRYLGAAVAIGLLQEIPFAISRYRYWKTWVFYAAAAVMGLIFGGSVFVVLGLEHVAGWANVIYFGAFVLSPLIFTWLGRVIAAGIDRTGVARGVQREIDTRRPRREPSSNTAAMTAA